MIVTLSYENLAGNTRTLSLGARTTLRGKNGVGKTSVAHAIAFVYTGADAYGNPAPVHLITEGQDKLTVRLETERSVLSRTLTQKKSQTLKATMKATGITHTLTQEEFAKMLCSRDAFLSAFVSGYFMSLPAQKKSQVLSEFLPPIDRKAVFKSLLGEAIDASVWRFIDLDKRTDLAKAAFSARRREVDKQRAAFTGKIELLQQTLAPGPEPVYSGESPDALYEQLRAWEYYRNSTVSFKNFQAAQASYEAALATVEQRRAEIQAHINSVVVPELPLLSKDWNAEIDAMYQQMRKDPPRPAGFELPDSDNCPTCGQVVGSRHRDTVRTKNEEVRAAYEKECQAIEAYNADLSKQIDLLIDGRRAEMSAWGEATKSRRTKENLINALRDELARLKEPARPVPITEPVPPPYPEVPREHIEAVRASYETFKRQHTLWLRQKELHAEASTKLGSLYDELNVIDVTLDVYEKVERVFDKLDEEIFKINTERLIFRGHRLVQSGDDFTIVREDGLPFRMMSAGQRIWAEACLCEFIANSLPRPVKFIYVDNADLVSHWSDLNIEQQFLAKVDKGEDLSISCH